MHAHLSLSLNLSIYLSIPDWGQNARTLSIPQSVSQSVSMRDYYINRLEQYIASLSSLGFCKKTRKWTCLWPSKALYLSRTRSLRFLVPNKNSFSFPKNATGFKPLIPNCFSHFPKCLVPKQQRTAASDQGYKTFYGRKL